MRAAPLSPIILMNLNTPWERVLHLGRPVAFTPKQWICFDQDDDYLGFYYIREGRIRLSYISSTGHEKVLFYIGRGSLFHDVPAVVKSDCVFTCMEPTSAVYFAKRVISLAFAREYPDLMLNWVESTARKSSNFYNQLCGSGLFDAFTNVCRTLYSMVLYNRENDKVVPHLTSQELAALLGIHRGSLHKALARLREEGVIASYSRHELVVCDHKKLEAYALA